MATYQELKEQAEKLLAEAEELREKEMSIALNQVKETIKLWGFTAQDLGLAPKKSSTKGKTTAQVIRYRGPNGETWGGGRGRKPDWILEALKQGRKLEEFRVQQH